MWRSILSRLYTAVQIIHSKWQNAVGGNLLLILPLYIRFFFKSQTKFPIRFNGSLTFLVTKLQNFHSLHFRSFYVLRPDRRGTNCVFLSICIRAVAMTDTRFFGIFHYFYDLFCNCVFVLSPSFLFYGDKTPVV